MPLSKWNCLVEDEGRFLRGISIIPSQRALTNGIAWWKINNHFSSVANEAIEPLGVVRHLTLM
ncbi:hypothetical protein Tco_1075837, partial [Tanacetum coccineum]